MLLYVLSVVLIAAPLVYGQRGTAQTFFPASIPLAVRTPYLSTWQNATDGQPPLSSSWPVFWTQNAVMEWTGSIRVDNFSYAWLGLDAPRSNSSLTIPVTNVQITPTRSIYVMTAGPMNITVTFLSPIEPSDFVKQSMPFSYLSVEATSLDNKEHSVQFYSDISTEWATGNRAQAIPTWKGGQLVGSSIYHQISIVSPATTETNNQMPDGTVYYAMPQGSDVTWQVNDPVTARHQFINSGRLLNTQATPGVTNISSGLTVFAFSIDLQGITSTANPVTWSVGYVRDPSIVFQNATAGTEKRRPYFFTQYSTVESAIDAFVQDFSAASDRAQSLDEKIISDAGKISSNYVDLVSLAARQVMGSMDITVLESDPGGGVDGSDVKIFVKDIGGSGRVNAVERIYQAFPAYLYFNASLLSGILRPMLQSQDLLTNQQIPLTDVGGSYPSPSAGRTSSVAVGVDDAGTMLIAMYAHARFSGDNSLLVQHYASAKRWANFLVQTVSNPSEFANQVPADQLTKNFTNLYLKGVIGVQAMAEISRVTRNSDDMQTYGKNASTLMNQWLSSALTSDGQRILGVFGDSSSWTLAWNLYADRVLGTNLVPASVLDAHTKSLATRLASAPKFGLTEDSSESIKASTVYTLFAAAVVTDTNVRDMLMQGVWNRANSNTTIGAFLDIYQNDGTGILDTNGGAGSTVGSMFSLLALSLPNTTIPSSTSGTQPPGSSNGPTPGAGSSSQAANSNTGVIVGSVLGGVAVTAIAVAGVIFVQRRRRAASPRPASRMFITENVVEKPPSLSLESGSGRPSSAYTHDNATNPSSAIPPHRESTPPRMTKAQEVELASARGGPSHNYRESLVTAAAVAASWHPVDTTNTRESSDILGSSSGYGSSTAALSTSATDDVVGLRAEVQNLRLVMEQIRGERFESPPVYQED